MQDRQSYLEAYGDWVEQLIGEGRKPHFSTFMFNSLGGNGVSRQDQMANAIQAMYSRIATRVCRNPRTAPVERLPILIAAPDFPVYTGMRHHLRDVQINDGLHMHGIWLMPERTRLEGHISGEFLNYGYRYAGPNRPIQRIVSDHLYDNPKGVTDYLLKSVKRQRVDLDRILVLPRSRTEL